MLLCCVLEMSRLFSTMLKSREIRSLFHGNCPLDLVASVVSYGPYFTSGEPREKQYSSGDLIYLDYI